MAAETQSGLIIAGETLAWASITPRGRDATPVVAAGQESLPPAATGGEPVARPVRVAAGLKALAPKLKGLLTLGLPSEMVMLRVLRLPTTDADELKGMVAFQAEKLAPFPADTMVVGHEVLQHGADTSHVLVAAVRIDVVEAEGAALKSADLHVARVDVVALGWWRLLADRGHVAKAGCQAHVLLTKAGAELIVTRAGVPVVFRTLAADAGGASGAAELAHELSFTLMALELEIGDVGEPQVVLWTEEAPTTEWTERARAALGPSLRLARVGDLGTAAEGLARRGSEADAFDLTPESWLREKARTSFRRQLILASSAILGVWLLAVGTGMGMLAYARMQLHRTQVDLEKVRKPALAVRETRRRVFMVQQYMSSSNSALECLREVALCLPPAGIELTQFSFEKGADVKLSGEAQSVAVVYEFKNSLDASEQFAEANLQGPRKGKDGREVFDVILRVAGAGS